MKACCSLTFPSAEPRRVTTPRAMRWSTSTLALLSLLAVLYLITLPSKLGLWQPHWLPHGPRKEQVLAPLPTHTDTPSSTAAIAAMTATAATATTAATAAMTATTAATAAMTATTAATAATLPSHSWHVLVAMIGRDVAPELPHVLLNVRRLAAQAGFRKTSVMLVENDSQDGTGQVFLEWFNRTLTPGHERDTMKPDLRQLPTGALGREKKDLTVLAQARNVYLAALHEAKYDDVDWLMVVDTDMCSPWQVINQTRVINTVAPWVDVLYANGVCGWYKTTGDILKGPREAVPSGTAGALPYYCDIFALRSIQRDNTISVQRQYTLNGQSPSGNIWWQPESCNASPSATATLPCGTKLGDRELTTPVVRVGAAFGGMALYRASLIRGTTAPNQTTCSYASEDSNCEHVPLGRCLHQRHNAVQVIATGLIVDWGGCGGGDVTGVTGGGGKGESF